MKGYKFLLILTLVIVLSLALVIWFYPPSEDFGEENPFWNGLKTFYSEFEASSIYSLDDLPINSGENVLVSIPYLKFTQPELEKLKDYVTRGGALILFDDYGYGNDIVDYLDLDFRFIHSLLDPLSNGQNEAYPRVTTFAQVSVTENVESIVLNHAAGLIGGSETEEIAWSSRFSFFDINNNSKWDEGEPKGPIPVAATLSIDDGYLVLIADPSILINSMVGRDNNYKFIENITQIKSPNPEILVDQSHLPKTSLYSAKDWLATARSWFSTTPAVSGVVAVALILTLRPLWIKKKALVL
jgi:hypothetical protein